MTSRQYAKDWRDESGTLDLYDELNVYLVINDLKPSTFISIYPPRYREVLRMPEYKMKRLRSEIKFKESYLSKMKKMLDDTGLSYRRKKTKGSYIQIADRNKKVTKRIKAERMRYYVGKDKESSEKLLNSIESKSERGIGRALGYPECAVENYHKVIDGEKRNGLYVMNCLAEAKITDTKIPTWMAHISFVPDMIDIVGGSVCGSCKDTGRTYERFVKKNNPELAAKLEKWLERRAQQDMRNLINGRL